MQGAGIKVETSNRTCGFRIVGHGEGLRTETRIPGGDMNPHLGFAALEQGTMALAALGDDVVDHYLNYARTEQRLFDEAVTCYERERLFERG